MDLPIVLISFSKELRNQTINQILAGNKAQLEHPDVLFLSEKLGIEAVKKVKEHLKWKPALAQKRIVVIEPADKLTFDSQNGLLKILEEPSENGLIVLGVENEESLLPTVISRCEVRILKADLKNNADFSSIETILGKDAGERLEQIEKIEDRKNFLTDLLFYYRSKLPNDVQTVRKLLEAEKWIAQNVSAKAVTDYLMLEIPGHQKTS